MSFVLNRKTFLLLCAAGVLGRLYLVATTYGTNDANFWSGWVSIVRQIGFVRAYRLTEMINHPPPALALGMGISALARHFNFAFIDLFRLVQVIADVIAAVALYRIGLQVSVDRARALALFVLLSPAAAFISGFHCNSDPLMIALVVLAASFVGPARWQAVAVGVTLALATSVKIVPVILLPLFFIAVPRAMRIWFTIAYSAVMAVSFLPAIIAGGLIVVLRIFGYGGSLPYDWGITGVAWAIHGTFPAGRGVARVIYNNYVLYGRFVVYLGLVIAWILLVRKRPSTAPQLLQACAIVVLLLFAIAPGFGVQYMAWVIPLIPFALPWRWAIAFNAAASAFLFTTYTVWNGGWPWWYASIKRASEYRFVASLAGYVMWIVVCVALAAAVKKLGSHLEFQLNRAGSAEGKACGG
jgi:hypothetical protein